MLIDMKGDVVPSKKKRTRSGPAVIITVLAIIFGTGVIWAGIFAGAFTPAPSQEPSISEQIDNLQAELQSIKKQRAVRVRLTSYNSVPSQTDSTPRITAINTRCRPGVIAVSRDLIEAGWSFGSKVWIEGYGVYVIEDVMDSRIDQSIDIWQPIGKRPIEARNVLAAVVRW